MAGIGGINTAIIMNLCSDLTDPPFGRILGRVDLQLLVAIDGGFGQIEA